MKQAKNKKTGRPVAEPEKKARGLNRQSVILLIILAAGFLLRLIYVLETEGTPFFEHLFSDSKIYNDWARGIAEGNDPVSGRPFFMAPVYPYFLGIIYTLFGYSISLVRIIQVIISTANIYLIYLLVRRLSSERTALAAAVISALYSTFIFYSGAILSETLQTFCVTGFLLAFTIAYMDKSVRYWVIAGLLLGLSAVFRANILLFAVFMLPWMAYSYKKGESAGRPYLRKAAIYFVAGTMLPVLAVTVRNFSESGELVLLTSNGGINFYLGNNQNSPGVFVSPKEFDFMSDLSGEKYAEKLMNTPLSASEASSYWFNRGWSYITSAPGDALALTLKKVMLFLGGDEYPQSTVMDPGFFRDHYSTILKLPLVNFHIISLLAIAGLIIAIRKKSRLTPVMLFFISFVLSSVIFFVNGRFRLALTPVFIFFAALAAVEIYNTYSSRDYRKLIVPAASVCLFAVLYYFVIPRPQFNYHEAFQKLGQIDFDNGRYGDAIENYKKSLSIQKDAITYLNLGNAYAAGQDFNQAREAYSEALRLNPGNALTYFNMGLLYARSGSYQPALDAFKEVLKLDPFFYEAYRNLAYIYYIGGDYRQALYNYNKYLPFAPSPDIRAAVLEDMRRLRQMIDQEGQSK